MKSKFLVLAIAVMAIFSLALPLCSAMDWDNVHTYDSNTKTTTIINALGLGGDVAKITLLSEQHHVVTPFAPYSAEIEVTNYEEDRTSFINKVDFYDYYNQANKKNGYFTYEFYNTTAKPYTYDVNKATVTGTLPNGTDIVKYVYDHKATGFNGAWQSWDLNNPLPLGTTKFRAYYQGFEYPGQRIEWIGEFYGVRVTEWADVTAPSLLIVYPQNTTYTTEKVTAINVSTSYFAYGSRVNDTHGDTLTDFGTTTAKMGNEIHTNYALKLISIDLDARVDDATKAYVMNGSETILKTVTFSGTHVDFNYDLENDHDYIIVIDDNGGEFKDYKSEHSFPTAGTNVNFIAGYRGAITSARTNAWLNITTVTSAESSDYSCSYTTGDWATNYSFSCNSNVTGIALAYGSRTFGVLANDSAGNSNLTSVTFYQSGNAPNVSITYPTNTTYISLPSQLNYTVSSDVTDCWYSFAGGANNQSIACGTNLTGLNPDVGQSHTWAVYANNSANAVNSSFVTFGYFQFLEKAQSYNASTYETSLENYNLNITYDSGHYTSSSASLIYNGTSYAGTSSGTGDNRIFTKSALGIALTAKQSQENRTFYWQIGLTNTTGTYYVNSSKYNQTTNFINLSLCDATYTERFLNISFKDESSAAILNATLTNSWIYYLTGGNSSIYRSNSYASTTETGSYGFCFSPVDKNITVTGNSVYAASGYPQRTSSLTSTYTNFTTNRTLYLLSSSAGIYTTFQVLSPAGNPLSGVNVTATTLISSVSTIIGSGTTGDDGGITFWVDSTKSHTFTFVKTGYTDVITTITPTQSQYTVYMGDTTNSSQNTYNFNHGITYTVSPSGSILNNNTAYTFNFSIRSSYWSLTDYGFTLTNNNSAVLGIASGSTSTGSDVTLSVNTGTNATIIMNYYWNVGGNYTNATKMWTIYEQIDRGVGLKTFFNDLKTFTDSGMFGLNAFSRTLIIFVIIFISVGFICYASGVYSPQAVSAELLAFVWFFNYLDMLPHGSAMQYTPTILMALIVIAIWWREAVS